MGSDDISSPSKVDEFSFDQGLWTHHLKAEGKMFRWTATYHDLENDCDRKYDYGLVCGGIYVAIGKLSSIFGSDYEET